MDTTTARKVGKSELTVSPLGFGAGPFGDPRASTQTCFETVNAAWEGGVRFYDTAPWYGVGRSERRLGMALAERSNEREAYRVNTKVGRTLEPEPTRIESNKTLTPDGGVRTPRDPISGHRVHFNYTYDAIISQHRDSLTRLGLPSVDSLTIHDLDYGYQAPEQMETALGQLSRQGGGGAKALEELREAGIIKAIGAGCNREMRNYDSWEGGKHEDLIERIADTVDLDYLVVAGPYNLLDTLSMRRVLPLCESRNMSVIIASPYAGGWLVAPEKIAYMYGNETPEDVRIKSSRMQAICEKHGVPLAAVALQFVLANPIVAATIPGAKAPEEAISAQNFLNVSIPAEVWSSLKSEGLLDENAPTPV